MSWRDRFEALLAELQAHPDLHVSLGEIEGPRDTIDQAEEELGAPLPSGVREFYSEIGRVLIIWNHQSEHHAAGTFNMDPILTTFGTPWVRDEYMHPWRVRAFDYVLDQPPAFNAHYYAGVDPERTDTMYWVHYSEGDPKGPDPIDVRPLGLGFEEYLDAALRARGFGFWQEAFAKPAASTLAASNLELMNRMLPELFDDFDPDTFASTPDAFDVD